MSHLSSRLVISIVVLVLGLFSVASASDRDFSLPVVAGGGAALLLLGVALSAIVGKRTPVAAPAKPGPAPPKALPAPAAPVSAVAAQAVLAARTARVLGNPIRVVAQPARIAPAPTRVVVPPPRVMAVPARVVPAPACVVPERMQLARGTEPSWPDPALVARVGPDLKTPLHALLRLGEALRDEKAGPLSAGQKAWVEDILSSGRRMLRLVNDASDLARLQAGKREFHVDRVSPEALVRDVCGIVRPLAMRKRITIRTEIDPALSEVTVDAAMLSQLLFERVSSALQLSPAGGQITIRVSPEAPETFRVAVDPGRVERWGGRAGLDATLERTMVEAQGGRVGVEHDPASNPVFFAILPRTI